MKPLSGLISDKLRKVFTPHDQAFTPPRPGEGAAAGRLRPAVPGDVEGHKLGRHHYRREPQRYRVAAWLVAVGALLIAAAVAGGIVLALTVTARHVGDLLPGRGVSTMPLPTPGGFHVR